MSEQQYTEQEIRARRAERIKRMQKEKQRTILLQKCIKFGIPALAVILVIGIIFANVGKNAEASDDRSVISQEQESASLLSDAGNTSGPNGNQPNVPARTPTPTPVPTPTSTPTPVYSAHTTEDTIWLGEEFASQHALFIDLESGDILAQKAADTIISPASMTKVLTVLVAAEHLTEEQLDDHFTMTLEITDYAYVNDCSSVGFLDGEVVTVRDLFYGTILPSGGDAAVGLATYVAGSHEAFVELMNEKLEELGLSDTAHFTNCVGLYDKEHYCTIYDMAMIMEAAMENDMCREAMSARIYTTSSTTQHPEGITVSNWFIRRIEDKDTGGKVICAKTGYVVQSGNCAVSYGTDHAGKEYVCVTANAHSSWRCIYDHVELYKRFATENADVSGN